MIKICIGWFLFIIELIVFYTIDYQMRISDGDIKTGGLADIGLHIGWWAGILIALPFVNIILGTKKLFLKKSKLTQRVLRIIIATAHIPIWYAMILIVLVVYICESGIDCF